MLFLQSELLRRHGVVHGFSVRTGGVSAAPFDSLNLGGSVGDDPAAVDRNKRLLFSAAGVSEEQAVSVNQVHGDRVVYASPRDGRVALSDAFDGLALDGRVDADAIIALPGVVAGVRTADCVPILLHDPDSGASAAVHAGWRGTRLRLAARAVEQLVRTVGASPQRLLAAIGPAIGPCCFEVSPDVADHFRTGFGAAIVAGSGESPKPHVDLFEANRQVLGDVGLAADDIEVLRRCTSCEPEVFYSHRRDKGATGRHLSFILAGARGPVWGGQRQGARPVS